MQTLEGIISVADPASKRGGCVCVGGGGGGGEIVYISLFHMDGGVCSPFLHYIVL